jgi:hypothetical protein
MTSRKPTAMEQATIDRLGIFDEEKFAEIVGHDDTPTCSLLFRVSGAQCVRPATHRGRCRSCGSHLGLACSKHAAQMERSTEVLRHAACGAEAPLNELIEAVPL